MTTTSNKAQLAYEFVKQHITSGRYTPGYRLVLATIAAELGVSVVPVREAIRRLEAERLVTFERNVGAHVAMLDEREYLYTMQTLALVEGYATALSAPLLTPDQVRRAREVNERMRESLTHFQPHEFTRQNFEFHSVLFECCPNPHILDLVHRGWNRLANLRDSTFSFVPGRAHESVEEHEQILHLIEQGAKATTVEHAAREHRTQTLDAFLAHQGSRLLDD
ncbi:MAG TPA: GntR family transcriptional regulator [Pseudonocardiaceae bacterium]|jgi:DNA-binding GntR family transcriptional regulator|nr:GntR family transcriptional regulator [Pseudonocardiaceae bacterium]